MRDGFDAEQAYFKAHPSYGGAPAAVRERLGVPKLSNPNPNPNSNPNPSPNPNPNP